MQASKERPQTVWFSKEKNIGNSKYHVVLHYTEIQSQQDTFLNYMITYSILNGKKSSFIYIYINSGLKMLKCTETLYFH